MDGLGLWIRPGLLRTGSRQCLSRNGCSQIKLKAGVMGHSVLFLFPDTDTTNIPACPQVWKEKSSPLHCVCRCSTEVLILPRSPDCLFLAGRTGPRALPWAAQAKWVMWRATLMSEMGWQSSGQVFGIAVCQGQVEKKSCVQQNQPLCLFDVSAQ